MHTKIPLLFFHVERSDSTTYSLNFPASVVIRLFPLFSLHISIYQQSLVKMKPNLREARTVLV